MSVHGTASQYLGVPCAVRIKDSNQTLNALVRRINVELADEPPPPARLEDAAP